MQHHAAETDALCKISTMACGLRLLETCLHCSLLNIHIKDRRSLAASEQPHNNANPNDLLIQHPFSNTSS